MYSIRLSVIMLFSLAMTMNVFGQAGINLGTSLNSMLESEFYPSISGNGKTMILQSTTGEDGQAELVISYLKGNTWTRPEAVPNVKPLTAKTPLSPDYSLSMDGNTISFSSPKYGGVGGADIWFMEKTAAGWMPSKNPGKPINSIGNEGDPSLSSDGRFLYFVRYSDKKTAEGKPCGKIYVSEKTGNLWKEPKELPAPVNKGCDCNPTIMADNQTLLFSSQRTGGKGGYDFYMTRLQDNGSWAEPKALAFLNTTKDDVYASIPASGDFIYYSAPGKKGTDIFKMKLPEEFQPKKVLVKEGLVKDASGKTLHARAVAYDLNKNNIAALYETDFSGAYQVYLPEGSMYDFSVSSTEKGYTYDSEFIDLMALSKYTEDKKDISLSPLKSGASILLGNLSLDGEGKIQKRSSFELMRIQRLLQENPTLKVEIGVHKERVVMDTIANPTLTEVLIDSFEVADPTDSTGIQKIKIAKTLYHNDRTPKDAAVIVKTLHEKGIPSEKIEGKGYGDSKPLYPPSSPPDKFILNNRIELTVIK